MAGSAKSNSCKKTLWSSARFRAILCSLSELLLPKTSPISITSARLPTPHPRSRSTPARPLKSNFLADFGTNPGTFTQGLVAGTRNGNTFTFTHPLNANPASDLTATYRWSTDLATFHDDGDPNGAGTTTVTFSDPTPAGAGRFSVTATMMGPVIPGRLFVDVRVTQP